MRTHINRYNQTAQFYFEQKFQGGFLDPDTAVLIEKAIDKLLKKDNIFRNENIPNQEQVISEEDYVKKHQQDDDFYRPENTEKEEEGIQNDENLDYDDLEQRNE